MGVQGRERWTVALGVGDRHSVNVDLVSVSHAEGGRKRDLHQCS